MQTRYNSLERLSLSNKPKVIITPTLKSQIDFLHEMVGTREWSGELITSETGKLTDLDDWTITAESIYLADIGSGAYTGYQVDKGGFKAVDIIEMYDAFPGLLEGKQKNHHIHTHHSMGAFMSGTDWDNLTERADVSNYFMMLVVDFKDTYVAKMAFRAKIKGSGTEVISLVNNQDGFGEIFLDSGEREKEVLVVMSCEVVMPAAEASKADYRKMVAYQKVADILRNAGDTEDADRWSRKGAECSMVNNSFIERYNYVKKAVEEEARRTPSTFHYDRPRGNGREDYGRQWTPSNHDSTTQTTIPYSEWDGRWQEDISDLRSESKSTPSKRKRIMEMTDKEYREYLRQEETYEKRKKNNKKESKKASFKDAEIRIILNSAINEETFPLSSENPIPKLMKLDKEVPSRTLYATHFIKQLSDNFEVLYPNSKNDEDYLQLLNAIADKLYKFKTCDLIDNIVEVIGEEIMEYKQLIGE